MPRLCRHKVVPLLLFSLLCVGSWGWLAQSAPVVEFAAPTLLDRLALTNVNTDLDAPIGYRANYSGCCIMPDTGELLAVLNRGELSPNGALEAHNRDGSHVRHIGLTGFDDTEGICLYDAASNQYAILEEALNDITIVTITAATTNISKSSGRVIHMGLGNLLNSGTEGVTYDASNRCFYVVKEKAPMAICRVTEQGSNALTEVLFDAPAAFNGACTDLSDLYYEPKSGRLFILSQESRLAMECDLQGQILAALPVDIPSPEGIVITEDASQAFFFGEPNHFAHYVVAPRRRTALEGTEMLFDLCLSEPAVSARVDYVVSSDTAVPGADYSPAGGTVAFSAEATSATFSVAALADLDLEGPEFIHIALTNAVNAELGDDIRWTCEITDAGRIEWNPVASPQYVSIPFPVTLTARDPNGVVLTGFTNAAALKGNSGVGQPQVDIGAGSAGWFYPMAAYYHDARTQVIYLSGDIGESCTITGLALNVLAPPGQVLNGWTLRMKHTPLAAYPASPVWEGAGWTTVFQTNEPPGSVGWRAFRFSTPFEYNVASNLMIDFSFNNSFYTSDGTCQCTPANGSRSLYYRTDSGYGNPLAWSGTAPPPTASTTIPNIRLFTTGGGPMIIAPEVSGGFVAGVWTGAVAVLEASPDVILTASVGSEHASRSASFAVLDGLPVLVATPANAREGDGVLTGQGRVSLLLPASSNVVVALSSSDESEIAVTNAVTIPEGATSASFDLTVIDDADLDGVQQAVIGAAAPGYLSGSNAVSVTDNETATLTVVVPAEAREGDGVLTNAGTVVADRAPVSDFLVQLSSDDPTEAVVTNAITLAAGQTNALFDLRIVDDTAIDGLQTATLRAHVDDWTDGAGTIRVTDNEPANLVVLMPASATEGDGRLVGAGKVQIAGTWTADLLVTLETDDPSEATVTNSVTIASGQTDVAFDLVVGDDLECDGKQWVTVTAHAAGFAPGSNAMDVVDNDVHHFVLSGIASQEIVNVPFSASVMARTVDEMAIPSFAGWVTLQAWCDGNELAIVPGHTSTFAGGTWTGDITVGQAGTNVTLTVSDGLGHGGASMPFDVRVQRVFHVAPAGLHRQPYANWTDAATNIQAAVDLAEGGDTVLVSNGTYVLSAGITVLKPITVRSVNGATATVVDGQYPLATNSCFDLDYGAALEGFTITKGCDNFGGGIGIGDFGGAVRRCTVAGNLAFYDGGGVFLSETDGATSLVENCAVFGNQARTGKGGGASVGSGGTVRNCVISNNAAHYGGGVSVDGAGFVLGCTIAGNTASHGGVGGGIHCEDGGAVRNTILYFNMGSNWHNGAPGMSYEHCCVTPDPGGTGNTTNEPRFVDYAAGDLHLSSNSPCVDAGTNLTDTICDFDGVPRPLDGDNDGTSRWDIGAYEFVNPLADSDRDGMRDADERVAGTSPVSSNDCLKIDQVRKLAAGGALAWDSVSGRFYAVLTTTDLMRPWEAVPEPAYSNLPGTGGPLWYTNTDGEAPWRFYRIRVREP